MTESASTIISLRETTCQSCSLRNLCLPISLDLKEAEKLNSIVDRKKPIKKGEYLFRQGDPLDSLYAIRSGCIKIFSVTESGEEQITGFSLPGELIGLSGLDKGIFPVAAQAIETTTICEIPYSKFDELSESLPPLRQQLIKSLSKALNEEQRMVLQLSQKTAEERLANFLLDLSARIQQRGYAASFIYLSMSRNEIANYLGLAVETVSRMLSRMQKLEIVKVDGRALEILDMQALVQQAGQCPFTAPPAAQQG